MIISIGKSYTDDVKILIDLMLMIKDRAKFWWNWIDISTQTHTKPKHTNSW